MNNFDMTANQQNDMSEHPLGMIYGELSDMTRRVSDLIHANPDINTKTEEDLNRQLAEIIKSVNTIGTAHHQMAYAKKVLEHEMSKIDTDTGDQCAAITNFNPFGRVVGSFNALLDGVVA